MGEMEREGEGRGGGKEGKVVRGRVGGWEREDGRDGEGGKGRKMRKEGERESETLISLTDTHIICRRLQWTECTRPPLPLPH